MHEVAVPGMQLDGVEARVGRPGRGASESVHDLLDLGGGELVRRLLHVDRRRHGGRRDGSEPRDNGRHLAAAVAELEAGQRSLGVHRGDERPQVLAMSSRHIQGSCSSTRPSGATAPNATTTIPTARLRALR